MTLDKLGNIYVAGDFTNDSSKQYVAKWDGTTWKELGIGINTLKANSTIVSIVVDDSGNVYAGGYFKNINGYNYVAKWDGTTWSELGSGSSALYANEPISSIVLDKYRNVYATGFFTNTSGYNYVAKYSQPTNATGITNSTNSITIVTYPNPTTGNITINTPEAWQVVVYSALGEVVITQTVQTGNTTISLGDVPTGLYTLILTGQNNTCTPIKVVKN